MLSGVAVVSCIVFYCIVLYPVGFFGGALEII